MSVSLWAWRAMRLLPWLLPQSHAATMTSQATLCMQTRRLTLSAVAPVAMLPWIVTASKKPCVTKGRVLSPMLTWAVLWR